MALRAAFKSGDMTLAETTPWKRGDFHVIGAAQTMVGEVLCEEAGVGPAQRLLDIACGSGNTALAAARRGASVVGIDIVDALIERARARANSEGFEIDFRTGNAEELPFDDEKFDVVLSTFGIMFAPDQQRAAAEALRVCKHGGMLAFSSWTPESMPGTMFALSSKYAPPPPGMQPPVNWGTVPGLQRLFGDRVERIRLNDHFTYARAESPEELLATFKRYFGPIVMMYERVPAEQHGAVDDDFTQIYKRFNRATDGTLRAAMAYVNVVMTKR